MGFSREEYGVGSHPFSRVYIVEWALYHRNTQTRNSYEFLLWSLELSDKGDLLIFHKLYKE